MERLYEYQFIHPLNLLVTINNLDVVYERFQLIEYNLPAPEVLINPVFICLTFDSIKLAILCRALNYVQFESLAILLAKEMF